MDRRTEYRTALGSGERRVILLSSTWWANSLLGSWPDLIRNLLGELPADEYQVIAALHPNIWHGHGPWQVRTWLGDCLRSGLVLLSEVDGWRPGMIAADLVIGDHGSVTGYAAASGRPVVLAAFADEDIAPGSPVWLLGQTAPRLRRADSLVRQVESAIGTFVPGQYDAVASLVTSAPGESLIRLRELFYRLLSLPEPDTEPPMTVLSPDGLADAPAAQSIAMRVEYEVDVAARAVRLVRYPAETRRRITTTQDTLDAHISCPVDHPMRTILGGAAVVTGPAGEPDTWFQRVLDKHPYCAAAALLSDDHAVTRIRDGAVIEAHCDDVPAALLPSAVHAWSSTGETMPDRLYLNGKAVQIRIRP
jgi:hypothetical protein